MSMVKGRAVLSDLQPSGVERVRRRFLFAPNLTAGVGVFEARLRRHSGAHPPQKFLRRLLLLHADSLAILGFGRGHGSGAVLFLLMFGVASALACQLACDLPRLT